MGCDNHYQEGVGVLLEELLHLFDGEGPFLVIKCIGPNASFEDDNLFVKTFGINETILPVSLVSSMLDKTRPLCADKNRQDDNADIGYCSSVNCARNQGCNLGLIRPQEFRTNKLAGELLGITNEVFSRCEGSQLMNNFAINRNRHEDFGKRLHNNNLFEAIRIHRTYVDQGRVNKCQPHVDNKNSKKGCLRRVLWWSALVMFQGKLTRIGMVGYWRSSIDDYMDRKKIHAPYLRCC